MTVCSRHECWHSIFLCDKCIKLQLWCFLAPRTSSCHHILTYYRGNFVLHWFSVLFFGILKTFYLEYIFFKKIYHQRFYIISLLFFFTSPFIPSYDCKRKFYIFHFNCIWKLSSSSSKFSCFLKKFSKYNLSVFLCTKYILMWKYPNVLSWKRRKSDWAHAIREFLLWVTKPCLQCTIYYFRYWSIRVWLEKTILLFLAS